MKVRSKDFTRISIISNDDNEIDLSIFEKFGLFTKILDKFLREIEKE